MPRKKANPAFNKPAGQKRPRRAGEDALQKQFFNAAATGDETVISRILHNRLEAVRWREKTGEFLDNRTALLIAAMEGHAGIAKLLLDAGADIAAQDPFGHTPVQEAARHGKLDVLQLLIDRGADINAATPENFYTPLMLALFNGHDAAAALLLRRGADANAANVCGDTCLHMAVPCGTKEMIWLLLGHGADRSVRNEDGHSAEDAARAEDRADIADFIAQADLRRAIEDAYGIDVLRKGTTAALPFSGKLIQFKRCPPRH